MIGHTVVPPRKPLLILLLLSVALLLDPASAWARLGGGEGFSSGGGGSGGGSFGSGGSGGDGFFLYLLIQMAFRHPVLGIPLLLVFVFFMFRFGISGYSQHVSRSIRTGYRVQSARERESAAAGMNRIQKRDPGFSLDRFAARITGIFPQLQEAWSRQDMKPLRAILSDGVFERLQLQLEMMKARRVHNTNSQVKVLSSRVVGVRSDSFFDTVHFSITASALDETVNSETGKLLKTGKRNSSFTEIWSFLRKPGVKTLANPGLMEGFCPNCGTRLEISDSLECPSCRSIVNSGEYDWVLAEITQEEVWRDRPAMPIPGVVELREKDPAFNLQHVEDKASVIFWRHRAAELFASETYLKKVALPEYLERTLSLFHPQTDGRHIFYADPALGAVEVVEVCPAQTPEGQDSVRVKMTWSGHKEKEKIPSFLPPDYSRSRTVVQEYILVRNTGVMSSAKHTLSSAHCPACGAPETRNTKGECEYCRLPRNDGSSGWVLSGVRPFTGAPLPAGSRFASSIARELGIAADPPVAALPRVTREDSLALMACAVAVMKADGQVDERETVQLRKMAERRKIGKERLDQLIRESNIGDDSRLPAGGTGPQKREFLRSMILMCLADGNVSRPERALIQRLGERVGLERGAIQQMIRQERSGLYQESRRIQKDSHLRELA
jgi:uncharacterized tellurite resistance protein B-like protein